MSKKTIGSPSPGLGTGIFVVAMLAVVLAVYRRGEAVLSVEQSGGVEVEDMSFKVET